MSYQNNIPQLRFAGFVGEWEKSNLNKFASLNPKNSVLPESFIYIDLESVTDGLLIKESVISKNEAPSRAQRVLKDKDILYQTVRPYQKNNLYFEKVGDYVASTGYAQIRTKNNSQFLFQFLHTEKFVTNVMLRCTGTSYPAINSSDLSSIEISFPSLPEQQTIASFLSAVDEKIQQLSRKKELLEQYKKGVMQQLFSGKLRFKDENGKDYADWEKKKLGDVAEVKRGAASQHLNYVSDETKGIRLLRINDFLSNDAVYVENTLEMKRFTVQTNDILIAGTGATAGIIFIVPEKFNNLSFSYNAPRIRVKNAYHTFIYHYLKSGIILKQQQRLFVGNAQPFLDTDAMRGFKIKLPSIKEQQKIANFLSSIDAKIESTSQQINQTQSFKKGLLQQLFV